MKSAERDPERVCPLLAATGIIRGGVLTLRLAGETIKLRAPRSYLTRLFDWCQGELTLAEIKQAAIAQWGNDDFSRFVDELLGAGVLIDTATLLQHAARAARFPNWMGRPADMAVWRAARRSLPQTPPAEPSTIALSSADPTYLTGLLGKRHSADAFVAQPLPQSALFRLLHAAYGAHASGHRSVASAGGFYELQLHLVLLKNVDGAAQGTYQVHFDALGGVHLQCCHGNADDLPSLVYHPHMLRNAAGLIVVTADLRASTLKYGNRSYPFALLEAGAVIQNIALAAAEQGVGWRALGGLELARVTEHCGLDEHSHVLIAGVFGARASEGDTTHLEGTATRALEFLWSDEVPGLPFHLAMARLDTDGSGAGSQGFGWGRDANAWRAYDKAVAEATERHAYRQPRSLLSARWKPDAGMCDPRSLVAYTRAQYRRPGFPYKPFDPEVEYLWLAALSISGGASSWVPAECVLHRTALPESHFDRLLTSSSSSGCASGTSVAMAQQSALFELIERDAFMRHWFAQRGGIEIDETTLPSEIGHRIEELRAKGCRTSVQVLDLAVEPVWMIVIQHDASHFTCVGAAAGLGLNGVLHSALSEAETAAYARLAGIEAAPIRPADVKTPAHHADLFARRRYYKRADALFGTQGRSTFGDMASRHAGDMDAVHNRLRARGLDVLWIDLSVPDAPLTLAGERLVSGRVLVPGLIPIAFGAHQMAFGMNPTHHPAARFPHPFP